MIDNQKLYILLKNTIHKTDIVFDTVLKQMFFKKGHLNNDQKLHFFILLKEPHVIHDTEHYLEVNKRTGYMSTYQTFGNDIELDDSNRIHADLFNIISSTDEYMNIPIPEESFMEFFVEKHGMKAFNKLFEIDTSDQNQLDITDRPDFQKMISRSIKNKPF